MAAEDTESVELTRGDGVTGRRRVAVVGSGVSGLTAAWVLRRDSAVTLFEADERPGGHAHTHQVDLADGTTTGVDTGFIVHNDRTYPTLLRLFDELGVPTQDSDMSMSIRCDGCGLEYAGAKGRRGVFAQPGVLLRGRYLRMLLEILRFQRSARALLARTGEPEAGDEDLTLGDFLHRGAFSDYFTSHFMTPVVSAVWSCDPATALAYPARYLFSFMDHHGMLTIKGSPQWRTVTGGSNEYVRRVVENLDDVRLASPVTSVRKTADGVLVTSADATELFDAVIIATHPDQALAMIEEPTGAAAEVLGTMPYSVNRTQFHTDESVLPREHRARASWNYRLPACDATPDHVLVSYDMTRLQRLEGRTNHRFIVSLGEGELIDPALVLKTMVYEHPQYTPQSVTAQARLAELSDSRVAFAGAYHGWGFHEDGALSGLRAAERVGGSWDGNPAAELADVRS
ncbi:FAD-dependent oxidoreductase [Arthrobacter agilis]|uniref:NAD(P)/FAD-dependent oxidoreductase n=1 Tax=Arthrobacter agilis TaxID=37921 RepID=UPI000B35F3EF|nr:FAD-dependent oxidoreductase [Arthrobacter agilis]OUM45077.1 amine oxidase [Arthrobacter agilis]PPB46907.1 FAD-dependent oxidoreductase [Arthrobacter agilis]TPV23500.1 FAD-dependent oxidoreductase [Arthrobacter agilis]VDR31896.1 protoporphyrinogen oxidase [Arthrobacter agilis]